jgi:predicted ATPase/class 3 adenylate cyclase
MKTEVDRRRLPTGTVTFMFTDIEGSTELVHQIGDDAFGRIVEDHQQVIDAVISGHEGVMVATEGDSVFVVFPDAASGVAAALHVQQELAAASPEESPTLKVRIGLHTGNGVLGGDNYIGVDVHRASRISGSAHGGQIVVSDVTAKLVQDQLADRAFVTSLGRYQLAGFPEPTTLHQVTTDGLPTEFPPLRAHRAESQLPDPLTDFVGRESEIEEGLGILEARRLLTLTGPGGTGKTRLAIEIARRSEHRFADGAYFVPLAPLVDGDLIPMSILETLGVKTAGGIDPLEHLTRYLAPRSALLVLDNFEQLLEGAGVVTHLLSSSSHLKLMVTSRAALRLSGEQELPVPPLAVPDASDGVAAVAAADGVRLFVSRAQAVRPDFALESSNAEAVAGIARALDGLPLAIELAASRIRSITPELVLERLGNQLLASRSSDLPARQQTIVNTIGWSYDLLDEGLRRLFQQLSVFSGSFGVAEAENVYVGDIDILDGLNDLVEQSLLRSITASGESRFRMLTVIREFAFAALATRGQDRVVLDRHAMVYLELASYADSEILSSRQGYWLPRLAEEHDNLRAAFDHVVTTGDAASALGYVGALWRFWQMRGHLVEGRRRAETALGMPGNAEPLARARALTGLGGIRYWQGEWSENLGAYEEALMIFRMHGDDADIAEALYNLAFPLGYSGDLDRAQDLLRESLQLSERMSRAVGVGRAHWGLGDMATFRKDWSDALEHMEKAVEVFGDIDAPFDLGWARFMLAFSLIKMGNSERAVEPLANALAIFADSSDLSAMALILDVAGMVMMADSRETAAYLLGAARHIKSETGIAIGDVDVNQYPEIDVFLAEMDDSEQAAYEEGFNATLEEAVEAARSALNSAR